ncbi:hypothetical protein NPX13_g8477 [Xylaria arbuscula]|uniref:Uncharacterized protein n=1 Tax=Xylaria arbuscula TaxID=114810 RepID=A0A9W8TK44_9PEZI|nr:hypothetical protein NPX13_g8477 [Xylaria arbuscula]
MSPKVDSANISGTTARSAWSRDVRQDAVGVTYSRRSYYYDREFSDSTVARSSDDKYVDDLLRDDLVRPFVPFKQSGTTLQCNTALANEDPFIRGRVLQCASSDDRGDTGKGKKPVRDTLEVKRGEMHNSIPVVQTLPAVPLISRLAASHSGYVNGQVVGDESEDETSNLTLAGIDVKTIAQGIRFFVRVVDAYQRQQGDNVGGGETADDDDDDEEGGEILGWDLDPYHLEAGPPRRHWKKASRNRSSSTRNT